MKKGRLAQNEREKIIDLHKKGIKSTKIAEEVERSEHVVKSVIRAHTEISSEISIKNKREAYAKDPKRMATVATKSASFQGDESRQQARKAKKEYDPTIVFRPLGND